MPRDSRPLAFAAVFIISATELLLHASTCCKMVREERPSYVLQQAGFHWFGWSAFRRVRIFLLPKCFWIMPGES
jgi:hypothetical protein